MDSVTAFAPRRSDPIPSTTVASPLDAAKALTVTATYLLSEEGRKVSLLAGGDGRARQEFTVSVPANRLHLISVDLEGVARLKLRPWYELDSDERVVRMDELPTFDAPPSIDDLFKQAARNHQLERLYEAERRAAKDRRRDADRERRAKIAEGFLADAAQRALVHPAPTPKRCYLATDNGRVLFDVSTDVGLARDVPVEAHRRFRADLRGRRERNLQERAAQLALHEEKRRVIAEWVAAYGTPDQKDRQAAGVLPMDEALDAITDQAFAALGSRPRYVQDGVDRLQQHLRRVPDFANMTVSRGDLVVTSTNVDRMTAAQWALVNDLRALVPDATVTLRAHKIAWKRDPRVGVEPVFGVLVTTRVGPFTVRREYAAEP